MYNYGMEIFKTLNYNPNLSLALGFFDGVHLGHKTVIESAVNYARKNGNKSAVITFAEHPCCILRGIQPEYILTKTEREKTIEALGVDYLYELDFMSISNLTADATAGILSGFKWIEPALPFMYFISGYRAGIGYRNGAKDFSN